MMGLLASTWHSAKTAGSRARNLHLHQRDNNRFIPTEIPTRIFREVRDTA